MHRSRKQCKIHMYVCIVLNKLYGIVVIIFQKFELRFYVFLTVLLINSKFNSKLRKRSNE